MKNLPLIWPSVISSHCIGANLARIELIAALDTWLKRVPGFSPKPGTSPSYVTTILRTMRELELVF